MVEERLPIKQTRLNETSQRYRQHWDLNPDCRDINAELRRTMISVRQAGVTANRTAAQMNISRRTVSRICRRFIQTGIFDRRTREIWTPYSGKTGRLNVLCSNNDSCPWELLTECGMTG
ncbi:hypothetical protein LSH36_339g02002 [Paralvinella palmiformis]|uniref:Insertion element IS150 protein InsJ-like helix-turn-helix domain-containing protein n=1 Tax=Paralvinella palmiformis TaxID=53620 RepID=A0AAD9JH74_9ANNE|nr:hypothetical protein LSH36_339g02002 [Paralvinella palmiformis]